MALMQMNSEKYEAALSSDQVVMVCFWTDWRDNCAELLPIMEELAKRYEGRALIGEINADRDGYLALQLGIYAIPLVILYENGEEIDRIAGVQPLELYANALDFRLEPEEPDPYELINSMGHYF